MRNLVLDLRFASRLLATPRGLALVALLLLAIGIGVNVRSSALPTACC